jgi:hypothetical protein
MKICSPPKNRTTRRILSCASATALALACTVAQAHGDEVTAPGVPFDIRVPEGNIAFFQGHGVGTQNYACSPSGAGFAWILFTPEATLFNGAGKQVTTHFNSPNPSPLDKNTDPRVVAVGGAIRATWQHSRDSSIVWAKAVSSVSVRADSIAWVKLEVVGSQDGATGGDTLTPTTFIQRVNTRGGLAPFDGCSQLSDVGKKAFIPYTADYFFFLDPTAAVSN